MQRRNIRQEQTEVGDESVSGWVSDSREITRDEYEMLRSIEEIDTDKAIVEYTARLLEDGIL